MAQLIDRVCQNYLPPSWTSMCPSDDVKCVELTKGTNEYRQIYAAVSSATSRIVKIVRVQNPYLWGCYLLKKEEYKCRSSGYKELSLYHDTCLSHANSIVRENFDWRRSGRRAKYGKGVSFSYSPQYAIGNSTYKSALIVARVLVGNTHGGYWNLEIPVYGCDTTTSGGCNCNVYVKYSDHEFYPAYIVYH